MTTTSSSSAIFTPSASSVNNDDADLGAPPNLRQGREDGAIIATPSNDRANTATTQPIEDIPIPSVEDALDNFPREGSTASSSTHYYTVSSAREPSRGLSQTSRDNLSPQHGENESPARDVASDIGNVDQNLRNLRLSPESALGMGALANALTDAAGGVAGRPRQESLRPDQAQGIGRPLVSTRSRSNSRVPMTFYQISDEQPPTSRFHERSFQQAFGDAKKAMADLRDVLASSDIHTEPDSTMKRLHKDARNLSKFRCPSTRTVGFVGDSGAGKSSLLNSLLDFRALARTSNSGTACTCVATEYHYHESESFVIKVDTFSQEELDEQLTNLLKAYRHFHERQHRLESGEKEDFQARASVAIDTFRAMFGRRVGNERFLVEEAEPQVVDKLCQWSREAARADLERERIGMTLEQCSKTLRDLSSEDPTSDDSAAWPYIAKIRVFCNAHILSKGLILTDLPGLRDLNAARRNVTERYLRSSCHEIFVVCNIGRAGTDEGVQAVIELARQANLSNVGIICTKSDDIVAPEAMTDWGAVRRNEIERQTDAIKDTKDELALTDTRINEIDDAIENEDVLEGEEEEQRSLRIRLRNLKTLKTDLEFGLKKYLIDQRNADVEKILLDTYKDNIPGGELKIFCISSFDYWHYRDEPRDTATRFMVLSHIPSVRKHCISIVAESQFRTASDYINNEIPALVNECELWVLSGAGNRNLERVNAVREALAEVELRLSRNLLGHSSSIFSLSRDLKHDFKRIIYERRDVGEWSRAATQAGSIWSRWHHNSYSAFCRNYGHHCTGKAGYHCWNEEAMATMVQQMTTPFINLRTAVQERLQTTREQVENILNWAVEYLETCIEEFADSTETLCEVLTSRQHILESQIEDLCINFQTNVAEVKNDLFTPARTALFGVAMEEAYNKANDDAGSGSHGRRKMAIMGQLEKDSTFENIVISAWRRFNRLADSFQTDLRNTLDTHIEVIRVSMDLVRDENVALESERDPLFRAAVSDKVTATLAEMERIQLSIA